MKHKFPLATAALALVTILFTPKTAHAAPACFPAWSATAVYTAGGQASENSVNYTANWWTQGNSPDTNNGGSGTGQPWTSNGACSGGGTTNPPPPPPPPPAGTPLFAPYADMGITSDENLPTYLTQNGLKAFTLAFIVDNGNCQAGWGGLGGTIPQDSLPNGSNMLTLIQQIRSSGGDVVISFGGASGSDISSACSSSSQVQAMYQSVINRYSPTMIDFDIENGSEKAPNAILYRSQALAAIKRANPNLYISLTLQVLPSGLLTGQVNEGVDILSSAKASGFNPDLINVMAMDYGSSQDNGGQMGVDAIDAANATHQQVLSVGLSSAIGVTPMIGVNDTNTEIFQLADAQSLLSFAQSNSWVKRLSYWSVARDNGSCAGAGFASSTCSGLSQSSFAFANIFKAFQ